LGVALVAIGAAFAASRKRRHTIDRE
jgi:hypothetical protein